MISRYRNSDPKISSSGWQRLTTALEFYENCGYTYSSVPWLVDRHTSILTCPDTGRLMGVPYHGDLVGSAEQGFLELNLSQSPGSYVALTPCFRDEGREFGPTHRYTFMKVELFRNDEVDADSLMDVMTSAIQCMQMFLDPEDEANLVTVATPEGFDINLNGLEVGSYGIRTVPWGKYIYGTGLAEPRFELAMNRG